MIWIKEIWMEGQTDSKPKILSPKAAPLMYTKS